MVIIYAQNGDAAASSLAREDAARRYPRQPICVRNPDMFGIATAEMVADATAVYVRRFFPKLIEAYQAGDNIPVHVIEDLAAPIPAEPPSPPTPEPPTPVSAPAPLGNETVPVPATDFEAEVPNVSRTQARRRRRQF